MTIPISSGSQRSCHLCSRFCVPQLPCGSAGKESTCKAVDLGFYPGWEDPLEKGKATHSGLENSMDCIVHGVTKSRTRLSKFPFNSASYLSFHRYDKATKEVRFWVFPGDPVGKTSCSQCRGPGFHPWSGN